MLVPRFVADWFLSRLSDYVETLLEVNLLLLRLLRLDYILLANYVGIFVVGKLVVYLE